MMDKKQLKPEIDFKDLLMKPTKLFGLIYPYFAVLLIGTGVFYIHNIDKISFNTQGAVKDISSKYEKTVEKKEGGVVPSIDLKLLKNPNDEILKKGEELYKSSCSTCHGTSGKGDGTAGANLNPAPRNFHDKEGWTNGRDFTSMYRTLQEGIVKNGMAAYDNVPVAERVGVIYYIRNMVGDFPPVTDEEINDLDAAYNISAGTVIPNQIPVEMAIEKLIEEHSAEKKD